KRIRAADELLDANWQRRNAAGRFDLSLEPGIRCSIPDSLTDRNSVGVWTEANHDVNEDRIRDRVDRPFVEHYTHDDTRLRDSARAGDPDAAQTGVGGWRTYRRYRGGSHCDVLCSRTTRVHLGHTYVANGKQRIACEGLEQRIHCILRPSIWRRTRHNRSIRCSIWTRSPHG